MILHAALELVDREGADALTMRRLGSELGVEAMSLYRHVRNKEAVIDGLAEVLIEDIDFKDPTGDWTETVRSFANGARTIARKHPDAFGLVGLRPLNIVGAMRPIEALLKALREAGFEPGPAVTAYRLLMSYTRGFALIEIIGFTLGKPVAGRPHLIGASLPRDEFPYIRALTPQLMCNERDTQFRDGLDVLIAGLASSLEGPGARPAGARQRP